jgi:hypothetical protein
MRLYIPLLNNILKGFNRSILLTLHFADDLMIFINGELNAMKHHVQDIEYETHATSKTQNKKCNWSLRTSGLGRALNSSFGLSHSTWSKALLDPGRETQLSRSLVGVTSTNHLGFIFGFGSSPSRVRLYIQLLFNILKGLIIPPTIYLDINHCVLKQYNNRATLATKICKD